MGAGASLPHLQKDKLLWVRGTPAFKDLTDDVAAGVAAKVSLHPLLGSELSRFEKGRMKKCDDISDQYKRALGKDAVARQGGQFELACNFLSLTVNSCHP